MQGGKWATWVAAIAMVLGAASATSAQTATFSEINDAVAGRFYDATSSAPDALDGNKLIVGFNSGKDPATWMLKDFRASTAAFSFERAMDTISFRVDAPEGFAIARITYSQKGSGSVVRTGKAGGGANWVVGGIAGDLGTFSTNPTLTRSIELTGLNLTSVPVSITNALFAFSTPQLGSASVAITSAEVVVELTALTK
jgi:hypothetical protein